MATRYVMREMIHLTPQALYRDLPKSGEVELVFDDGVVMTHTNAMIIGTYPYFPLTKFPHVSLSKAFYLGDRHPSGGVINDLLNGVIWHIHQEESEKTDPEYLSKLAIVAVNRLFNDLTTFAAEHYLSMSAFDLLEIADHPDVVNAMAEVEPTDFSISKKVYPVINKVLTDPTILPLNALKMATLSGTVKKNQLLQVFGPMGFRTDLSGKLFPRPIVNSLVEGVSDLAGALMESRTGTIALLNNKDLLRETEYFNRQTQLIAQYVKNLHHFTDCGTEIRIPFEVTEKTLPVLEGKYYTTPDGGEDYVRLTDTHLIGTSIPLRSIGGCRHTDNQGVCGKCYGRMQYSVPYKTNVGNVSAVTLGNKVTSAILGTKHHVASSKVEPFRLGPIEMKYMQYGKGEQSETLFLSLPMRKVKHLYLTVSNEEVKNLANIRNVSSLEDFPTEYISSLTRAAFQYIDKDGLMVGDIVDTAIYNRQASFSIELLAYLREVKWDIDEDENIRIDLSNFPRDQPILTLPYKDISMFDVMDRIKSFYQSGSEVKNKKLAGLRRNRAKEKIYLTNYHQFEEALTVFNLMLNEKMHINLVHVEILLYAMMVRRANQDYRLPKPAIHGQFDKYNTIMRRRSLSASLLYEQVARNFSSIDVMSRSPRIDHPYDFLVMGGDYS